MHSEKTFINGHTRIFRCLPEREIQPPLMLSATKYGARRITVSWPGLPGVFFSLVQPELVAKGGKVFLRPYFGRRVMAGATAAKLFKRVCELIESVVQHGSCGPAPGNEHAETTQRRDPSESQEGGS